MKVTWREKVGLNWQGDTWMVCFIAQAELVGLFAFLGRN